MKYKIHTFQRSNGKVTHHIPNQQNTKQWGIFLICQSLSARTLKVFKVFFIVQLLLDPRASLRLKRDEKNTSFYHLALSLLSSTNLVNSKSIKVDFIWRWSSLGLNSKSNASSNASYIEERPFAYCIGSRE